MTRTLVTGADGFTGRYVSKSLAARGHEVHALVHENIGPDVDGTAQIHEADVSDLESLGRVVDDVRPEHVVHLAAISSVSHSDVTQLYRTNVVGTRQLLEAMTSARFSPKSILLASSANIYGNAREGILHEEVPAAPANDYGVSKAAMELVARLYSERLPLIVARPFNYTGRGQSTSFLIPKIVAHARERATTIELGNLDVARDFSDVRTVADAYARLLESSAALGGTFNICSGKAVSLQEVLDIVSRLSGHRLDVSVNPAFVRSNEVRSLCGSAAKLESVIGPYKTIPLEDTLRWMLEP